MLKRFLPISLLLFLALPGVAFAESKTNINQVVTAIDTIWVLLAGFLIYIMQAGFAMVESGFTRAKNAGNIMMKNLMDFCIGSIVYWLIGFGLMFGVSKLGIFGATDFFGSITLKAIEVNIPAAAFLIFQTMFAATAATIVSGAMAERTKFIAYVIYSFVISAFIYPVVGHWIWNPGGWLAKLGMIDFAGSTVVHSVGGWAALMGAYLLGPRIGKYSKDGKANVIPGHSITLAALGVFLLWFGWFGFNPGSTLSGMDSRIGLIAFNTNIAAAAGAVAAMIVSWLRYGKGDVSMTLNGVLAGLVAITAGAHTMSGFGALITGLLAGIVVVFSIEFIDHILKIDDPVGAVSVHGVNGALGTLLVGLFSTETGFLYGAGIKQLLVQALGVGSVFFWTTITTGILFLIIKYTVGLRVPPDEELEGLDVGEHGIVAYGDFVLKGVEYLEGVESEHGSRRLVLEE